VEGGEGGAKGIGCCKGGGREDEVRMGEFVGAGAGGQESSDGSGYVLRVVVSWVRGKMNEMFVPEM
jgi:hypothetical protein